MNNHKKIKNLYFFAKKASQAVMKMVQNIQYSYKFPSGSSATSLTTRLKAELRILIRVLLRILPMILQLGFLSKDFTKVFTTDFNRIL